MTRYYEVRSLSSTRHTTHRTARGAVEQLFRQAEAEEIDPQWIDDIVADLEQDDHPASAWSCRGFSVFAVTDECIVEPDRDGPTLWDCSCADCRRLQRTAP